MKLALKQDFKFKIPKKIIKIIIPFFIVIITLVIIYFKFSMNNQTEISDLRTSAVTKGNITTSVTGSGPIESSNRISLLAPGNTSITSMYFKEGDKVKKGQLLYTLDDTSLQQDILQLNSNLLQAKMTRNSDLKNINQLKIKAPFSGTVTGITINEGDSLQKGSPIFTITDTSRLKLIAEFNEDEISKIGIGDTAAVYIQNLMQSVDGTVDYVSNSSHATTTGGKVYDVEISINNPGALTDGVDASAEVYTSNGTQASVGNGTLKYARAMSIQPQAIGTVDQINVKENQHVNSGDILVVLKNDDLNETLQNDDNKIKVLEDQLKCDNQQFKNYKVTSPIDGSIVSQTFKQGDDVKSGDEISVLADTSKMQFDVNVDELDIEKIKEGQDVNVTVDAISQTSRFPLPGTVKKIAPEGTSTNGVTTYAVTIAINSDKRSATSFGSMFNFNRSGSVTNNSSGWRTGSSGRVGSNSSGSSGNSGWRMSGANSTRSNSGTTGNSNPGLNFGSGRTGNSKDGRTGSLSSATIRAGMNANAEILISSKKDVLTVPLEAIHRVNGESYVMVKSTAKAVEKLKKQGKYVDIFNVRRTFGGNNQLNSYSQSGSSKNVSGKNGSSSSTSKSGSTKNNSANSGNRNGRNSNNNSNNNSNSRSSSSSNNKQNEEYYKECIPTKVETGENDENNIEIVSGLKEGQVVVLPPITINSSSSNDNSRQQGNGQWGAGQGNLLRSSSGAGFSGSGSGLSSGRSGGSMSGSGFSGGGRN